MKGKTKIILIDPDCHDLLSYKSNIIPRIGEGVQLETNTETCYTVGDIVHVIETNDIRIFLDLEE